jgi:hypothetical protein
MSRKLLVQTAQHYYDVALGRNTDGEVYSMSEKLCCMEQALNHTENALFKTCCLLEGFMNAGFSDDGYQYFKEDVNDFLNKIKINRSDKK